MCDDVINIFYGKISIAIAAAGMMLAGCAVGPDFQAPAAPDTSAYTAEALPSETAASPGPGGAPQHFVSGQEIPAQWWTLLHSEQLDELIRQALADNPSLAAAQATLRQAQENLSAVYGSALFPSVDASLSASRQKISGASFGQPDTQISPFTLYNASVNVQYALDLFGGARRELEALRSQIDYERFQMEGAYLTITSNIVTAALKEAQLRAQILATLDIIAAQEKQLEVVERQFQLGAVTRTDVLAQRAQLAQTRTALPTLEKTLAQTRHQLAVLTGKLPSDAASLPEFTLEKLQLPQELPVSLPSSFVRQRPDIRASEALLHAASAQIGVATAAMYPQITLSGTYGSEATFFHRLLTTGTTVWGLSGGLLQPLFHGGELSAKRRAAIAAFDQASAQYRATVLLAFQNVADVLRALDDDARVLKAQSDAESAAADTFDLAQKQFQLGAINYLTLLNAERQHQEARINLVAAQAARFADTAALFQALGGGWWNRTAQTGEATVSKKE
jgi:NodT family efflux transporter outer membrane factor (OMF) lipoprotein